LIEVTIKHGKSEGKEGALIALIAAQAIELDLGVKVQMVSMPKDKQQAARLTRMQVRRSKPAVKVRCESA